MRQLHPNNITIFYVFVASYPSGLQLLFYACCAPWEWRTNFRIGYMCSFLNNIKYECPFDVFLVALENFTLLQFTRNSIYLNRYVILPDDLYKFLLLKASENVNDDNALTVISQVCTLVFYVFSITDLFYFY